MAKTFQEMRRAGGGVDDQMREALAREHVSAGKHSATKLRQAMLGKSGTLLHRAVAKEHGDKLFESYVGMFSNSKHASRLRYLTVVHSVEALKIGDCIAAAEVLRANLKEVLSGVTWLGVIENEMMNLKLLESFAKQDDDSGRVAGRKFELVRVLAKVIDEKLRYDAATDQFMLGSGDCRILVHAHIVLEIDGGGARQISDQEAELLRRLKKFWNGSRQVLMTTLSATKTMRANLKDIAAYGTKGGNEHLRYGRAAFGRIYSEDVETKMLRHDSRTGVSADEFDSFEDVRAMKTHEIRFLDGLTRKLMDLNNNEGTGYLVGSDRR